jgi:hypothetical protein
MPCDFGAVQSPLARLAPRAQGDWDYWMQPPSSAHALWLEGAEYVEQPLETDVSVSKQPAAFSATCDVATVASLEAGRRVAIVLTGSEAPLHFAMSFAAAERAVLSWQHGAAPASELALSWCSSCVDGTTADCRPLDMSEARAISGRGVLRVEAAAPLARAAVLELRVSGAD